MKINEKIFREYDIRGVADRDLPDELVRKLGLAIGSFIKRGGGKTLALGRDCRVSSPRIRAALSEGLLGCGLEIIDIGLVPTPLLYFATRELKTDSGIMITGSHNPAEHNGFKVCIGPSTIHGEDIQSIKRILLSENFVETLPGSFSETDVKSAYTEMVIKNIRHPLKIKVAIDSGNGMAGLIAPELFRRLGCEVTELYSEPDGTFPNHHPDPTLPESLAALTAAVQKTGSIVGIGFDGDADRIGAIDPTGRPIFGDELLVIYAREILKDKPGATVISEVKASHRLFQDVAAHGGNPIMWKTGHSLIKAKMKEEGALVAGEMSGHMFFNDRYFGFDDAIYAAARLFEIIEKYGKTPMELIADLPKSFCTPEIRQDCPDEIKFQVVQNVQEKLKSSGLKINTIDGVRVEFGDGWGLVRASNTQPVLVYRFEATSEARLNEIQQFIEGTVKEFLPT
jgi:phosphomannomutase / phosphoglucomutase